MKFQLLAICVILSACGSKSDIGEISQGPDAFSVVPAKPLEMPASFNDLPEPRAGANRAVATPIADAVVALGGRPGTGIAADAALLAFVTRFGTQAAVVGRRGDVALDADAETERFRAAGVAVPSAPPN